MTRRPWHDRAAISVAMQWLWRLRRYAAVLGNPLKMHMRQFDAAVRAAVAAVPRKPLILQDAVVLRRMCAEHPIPLYAPRRLGARARA
jgi:hypothetical protein